MLTTSLKMNHFSNQFSKKGPWTITLVLILRRWVPLRRVSALLWRSRVARLLLRRVVRLLRSPERGRGHFEVGMRTCDVRRAQDLGMQHAAAIMHHPACQCNRQSGGILEKVTNNAQSPPCSEAQGCKVTPAASHGYSRVR